MPRKHPEDLETWLRAESSDSEQADRALANLMRRLPLGAAVAWFCRTGCCSGQAWACRSVPRSISSPGRVSAGPSAWASCWLPRLCSSCPHFCNRWSRRFGCPACSGAHARSSCRWATGSAPALLSGESRAGPTCALWCPSAHRAPVARHGRAPVRRRCGFSIDSCVSREECSSCLIFDPAGTARFETRCSCCW